MHTLSQPEDSMKCGMCMSLQFLAASTGHHGLPLLAGYEDGTAALWDAIATGQQPLRRLKLHGEPILALATSREGRHKLHI